MNVKHCGHGCEWGWNSLTIVPLLVCRGCARILSSAPHVFLVHMANRKNEFGKFDSLSEATTTTKNYNIHAICSTVVSFSQLFTNRIYTEYDKPFKQTTKQSDQNSHLPISNVIWLMKSKDITFDFILWLIIIRRKTFSKSTHT